MENNTQPIIEVTTGILKVPGAELYYETKGNGPVLLMIPGANGDHFIFTPIREILSKTFTVVTYDRRGFSGSKLVGEQDYSHRINTDANDAASLIKHLTNEPAFVFASSSGALVSLQLMILHPEIIKALVPHEPTALKYLPDVDKWKATVQEIYDIYTKEGEGPAKDKFVNELIPGTQDGELMRGGKGPETPNTTYWFQHEMRQYPSTDFDTDKLEENKDKILFCVGRDSVNTMPAWPVTNLAKQFGTQVLSVPGGHLGYALHPADFAKDLLAGLQKRGKL
ncbi:alpha/beta fold hydrolase [Flavobacterium hungaricum]|uniref:Alpha/beta hydrolase n=1 Tax=Flavobacterium hungaricum TaxID=2082725 RepID=A0ABR9TI66_9FLAO|nr:alpha/beta fold hydrolase [Flavobacterium hungaricum]MBE8725040.1 alpha/beta hydrolase [Flavobacterium hungaricum]